MKNGLEINEYGDKFYYLNDQLHREDGPAIEYINGFKKWCIHGQFHRTDGPAIITAESKKWFINGLYHRLDGPAIEWADGDKWWYYHGERINCNSQHEFEQLIRLRAFL
jgi:hypothetical protein